MALYEVIMYGNIGDSCYREEASISEGTGSRKDPSHVTVYLRGSGT